MIATGSTGASLLFWFAGIPYCLAGAHVYVEYGLNVPRYVINGEEQSVPRSGGDLHYVNLLLSTFHTQRRLGGRANDLASCNTCTRSRGTNRTRCC